MKEWLIQNLVWEIIIITLGLFKISYHIFYKGFRISEAILIKNGRIRGHGNGAADILLIIWQQGSVEKNRQFKTIISTGNSSNSSASKSYESIANAFLRPHGLVYFDGVNIKPVVSWRNRFVIFLIEKKLNAS